jgi:NAD(P)-dependent dehydrogenase (short-subunit alcohol dehydrogenase family)
MPAMPAVLVTGASSGIGEATALRLARRGLRVLAGVRREEDAERLRSHGLEPVLLDITDADQIAGLDVGGELAGLVNNAGVALAAPLEFVPLDELRRQLEINIIGQVAVTQAVLPALRRGKGRVVFVGSIAGKSALPFLGPYAASKFGLEAIADSLRVELRPWGMSVSIVEPGSIKTPIWTKGAERADSLRSPAVDELYGESIEKFRKLALKRGLNGIEADAVARVVEHALTAARPKARYIVGKDARTRARLQRLPTRARDRVIARLMTGG